MLVSKKMTIGPSDPPVELLAGEQTEQAYELFVISSGPAPVHVGGPDVSPASSAPLPNGPFRLRGESLWVVGPGVGTAGAALTVFAYSTD